jgi:hypothetical protein
MVAFSPTLEAKDKGGHGKGGGGGGRAAAVQSHKGGRPSVAARPQIRSNRGSSIARMQSRPSQVQRFRSQQVTRPQVKRSKPSVALTGRSAAQQQRGANWNERRRKLIQQQYRQERREDRREAWEDRRDDWKDRRDDWRDDHRHYYVPFDVYRHWDHDRIYLWNNNRYRWYNNAWVVVSPGLTYGYDDGYYYGNDTSGSLAADVQIELARRGYDPGPADGVIGPQTRDAIADFQRDEGLPVTGRIDTNVVRELGL